MCMSKNWLWLRSDFFKLLKKKLLNKNKFRRKGILLLDEINLRESITVNSRTLTYTGLEDYGEEIKSKQKSNLKANNALVFMWQIFGENVAQPIAVFTSHVPVKGVDLAKLVIKATLLIEDSGGEVIGLTSDGASTNRTMWSSLGISAKKSDFKNYFENPYDPSRN
ncbi:uncharacterized protein LOC112679789, partial [Sipha flava]|uniref:Uncharacterized protein LOC112679789 n=1 Tax=Sipha flava TaxID=143950 RepID=A0A8B8F467_9HEMI